jgi:hypothetical protein
MIRKPRSRRLGRRITRGCSRILGSGTTRRCTPELPLPKHLRPPSPMRLLNQALAMLDALILLQRRPNRF